MIVTNHSMNDFIWNGPRAFKKRRYEVKNITVTMFIPSGVVAKYLQESVQSRR